MPTEFLWVAVEDVGETVTVELGLRLVLPVAGLVVGRVVPGFEAESVWMTQTLAQGGLGVVLFGGGDVDVGVDGITAPEVRDRDFAETVLPRSARLVASVRIGIVPHPFPGRLLTSGVVVALATAAEVRARPAVPLAEAEALPLGIANAPLPITMPTEGNHMKEVVRKRPRYIIWLLTPWARLLQNWHLLTWADIAVSCPCMLSHRLILRRLFLFVTILQGAGADSVLRFPGPKCRRLPQAVLATVVPSRCRRLRQPVKLRTWHGLVMGLSCGDLMVIVALPSVP